MFTKQEMQDGLRTFMVGHARGLGRIYGSDNAGGLLGHPDTNVQAIKPETALIEDSPLWNEANYMYDYGIQGMRTNPCPFGASKVIDAQHADVELFLNGLDSLELFLQEDDVNVPSLARRAMKAAIARHVLEGGGRYTMPDDAPWDECLSFAEIAILADMDERSVRNAANPKLPNPLVTEVHGKRTVVPVAEARRWLADRKGFVPTTDTGRSEAGEERVAISLLTSTADRLTQLARAAGVNVEQFIAQFLEEKQPC